MMAGNTATLQIKIKVSEDGTVQLNQVGDQLNKIEAAGGQAKGGLDLVSGGFGTLIAAAGAYLTLDTASKVIKMADEMSVLSAKIDLVTDSAAEQQAVQQQLYAISQETSSGLAVNTQAFSSLALAMKDQGASSREVLGITELVNKSLKVSGASTAEASSFMMQFKQALGSGVLQGEEFRAMMESNSVFAAELAKALNTDIGGLRQMSSQGQLTTDTLRAAFPAMAESINTAFDKIPVTIEGAITQVENAFSSVVAGANDASGGTQGIAVQISALAITVQDNAPAIQALFSGLVSLADGAVRSVAGLVGAMQGLASGATSVAAYAADSLAVATDYYGITTSATKDWKAATDAARDSAVDLAGKAEASWSNIARSTADAKKAQEEYQKTIAGSSEQVLKDIEAQKQRETEHSASTQRMVAAERKAVDERAKAIEEMYKATGVANEEYFRAEAQKILGQVEKWQKAGSDVAASQQYAYDKITALSKDAWAANEQAAGMYLDGLTASFTSAVVKIEQDVSGIDSNIEITASADIAQAEQGIADIEAGTSALDGQAATIKVQADTANFDASMSAVEKRIEGIKGQFAVNTKSAAELKAAIEMLNSTPTLDPFGDTRKKYRELLSEISASAPATQQGSGGNFFTGPSQVASYAGGGFTGSGPRSGGVDGMGGFIALLHPQETVVDHAQGQSLSGSQPAFDMDEFAQTMLRVLQEAGIVAPTVINNSFQAAYSTAEVAKLSSQQARISRRS
jgi:tape measure domain-containing protein